jgi:hypothetical protein
MSVTSWLSGNSRTRAISLRASQNFSSKATLVLRPRILIDRFRIARAAKLGRIVSARCYAGHGGASLKVNSRAGPILALRP